MNNYEPLDILFYKGNSLISKVIKKVSKSVDYSHCAVFIDHLHLLETSWKNPTIISHFGYRDKDYDVYRINANLTKKQKAEVMNFLRKRINISYDWLYVLTRASNYLIGTKIKSTESKYTCDELIVDAFKSVGVNLIEEGQTLSPEAIAKSKHLTLIERVE